ncbi:hypothetical protein RND71_011612 [Anisodus tanguticus]|uniref:Uncharacterized protein n=1 Tax=Anisodus tanguticus TaxID=243964 RepID=A0AAE1SDM6_9SOLA|nr:hypothetical protein RND71_011612 [Anisodus tanguticus]
MSDESEITSRSNIENSLLDECSQHANHNWFVDEQSDATIFNPESHSDLEAEKSEGVCDEQDEFEGSTSVVQETLVSNDQEFVLEDFAPILENVQLNVHVSTTGSLSKCASNSIGHSSRLFTNFNTSALSYGTRRHNILELSGEQLPIGLVLDAWVDTGQDFMNDSGEFEMGLEGSDNLKTAFAPYKLLEEVTEISFMHSFAGAARVQYRSPDNLLVLVREQVHWNDNGQLGEAKNALTIVLFLIEYMGHIVNHTHDIEQDAQLRVDRKVGWLFYFTHAYVSFLVSLLRLPTVSCISRRLDHSPLLRVTPSSHIWCEILCFPLTNIFHLHLYCPLGPLPVGELVFAIADLSIMAGQLQEVMIVIHIFIAGFCKTYLTLTQLNGLFSIWDGAYLYDLEMIWRA